MSDATRSTERVLVVGATGKAGNAVCESLEAAGYAVTGAARTVPGSGPWDQFIPFDLADATSQEAVVDALKTSDQQFKGVVVCAAGFYRGPLSEASHQEIRTLIDTSVTGTISIISRLCDEFREQSFDVVVITAANATALWDASRSSSVNVATKIAVQAFDTLAGSELAPRGVRITSIAPGALQKSPGSEGIPTACIGDAVLFALTLPRSVRCETLVLRPVTLD